MPRKKDYSDSNINAAVYSLHKRPVAIFHFEATPGFSERTINCNFAEFKLPEDICVTLAASYQVRMQGKSFATIDWDWTHLRKKFFPWFSDMHSSTVSLQELVSDKTLELYLNHVNSNSNWNSETAAGFFSSVQMLFKAVRKNNSDITFTVRKNYGRKKSEYRDNGKEDSIPPAEFKKIRAALMNEIKAAWAKFETGKKALERALQDASNGCPPCLNGTLEGILYYIHSEWNGVAPAREEAPSAYRKSVRKYFCRSKAIAMVNRFHYVFDLLDFPSRGRMAIALEKYGISENVYKRFGTGENGNFPPLPALKLLAKDAKISLEWLLTGVGEMNREDSSEFVAWSKSATTHPPELSTEEIGKYMYATSDTICFYIAFLATETAANTSPQLLWLRNILRENIFLNNVYTLDIGENLDDEKLDELSWAKGRAAIRQRLIFTDVGKWGPVALIKQVLQLTQPLVKHANPEHKNLTFLCRIEASGTEKKGPIINRVIPEMFRRQMEIFSNKYGFSKKFLTHGIIRTTALNEELKLSGGDILRTQILANHVSEKTTVKYLQNKSAKRDSDFIIGQLQNRMLNAVNKKSKKHMDSNDCIAVPIEDMESGIQNIDEKVTLAGGICKNIMSGFIDANALSDGNSKNDSGTKICDSWWSCFGCSTSVFLPIPRFVARWIHFIEHMESQKHTVAPLKWSKLYAPKLASAKDRLATVTDDTVLAEARELLPSLPPLPKLL